LNTKFTDKPTKNKNLKINKFFVNLMISSL
jgi:hypothetical protein